MPKENKLPRCPFCGGKVIYTECDRNIRQPDMVACIGDCYFKIMCDYDKGQALNWFMQAFKIEK